MIVFDHPLPWPKYGLCAHLVSDQPGEAGTEELKAFARKIGLKLQWIQKPETYAEHFDIMRGMIAKAEQAGAKKIGKREMVDIWKSKREAMAA